MNDTIYRQAAIDALNKHSVMFEFHLPHEFYEVKKEILGLPSAQQEQRWIPVSEMIPETDGYYLVTIKTFGWNGEQYEDIDIARYERKNGWLKADKCIAWMPLPKPYAREIKE